jgi:hypothetical protein
MRQDAPIRENLLTQTPSTDLIRLQLGQCKVMAMSFVHLLLITTTNIKQGARPKPIDEDCMNLSSTFVNVYTQNN